MLSCKDTIGKAERFVIFSRDITENKSLEEQLKIGEEKFCLYFKCSPNSILITDSKGKILQVNPSSSKITGYSTEEDMSMYIFDYLPERELE